MPEFLKWQMGISRLSDGNLHVERHRPNKVPVADGDLATERLKPLAVHIEGLLSLKVADGDLATERLKPF